MSEEPSSIGGSPDSGVRYAWEQDPDERPRLRDVRIVVPPIGDNAGTLRIMARAVTDARSSFITRYNNCVVATREEKESPEPDPVRLAFWKGKLSAYRAAATALEEELLGRLRLWLMYELQDPPTLTEVQQTAVQWCWRPDDRPEIPLSETLPDAARLVALIREQRDTAVRSALHLNKSAVVDHAEQSPAYEEYLAAARTMAQAADDLEFLLARAHGTEHELPSFLDEHGTWQSRIVLAESTSDSSDDLRRIGKCSADASGEHTLKLTCRLQCLVPLVPKTTITAMYAGGLVFVADVVERIEQGTLLQLPYLGAKSLQAATLALQKAGLLTN